MNKYLKYGLLTAGGVAVIAGGGAAYIAATFNPNDYKPQIIKAVRDSKHRDLTLGGDISLTFFPSIGASVDKVALSEPDSEKQFAAISSAHVSLDLLPLLSKQVVVNQIQLSGVKINLVKHKDGSTNIDDLLGGGSVQAAGNKPAATGKSSAGSSAAPQVKLDIASVNIDHTDLNYHDEGSGARYALNDLTLKTGRIAAGEQTPLELSAHVQASQPKLDVAIQAKTGLDVDLEHSRYQVKGLDLQATGNAAGVANLALQVSGDAAADLAKHTIDAHKLTLSVSGKQGGNDLAATLALPSLTGSMTRFGSKDLSLSMDAKGDALPGKHVSSKMNGSFAYDGDKQDFSLNLAGGLLQSKVKAMVAVSNFANPHIRFTADVDQFDLDTYFPPSAKQPGGAPASGGSAAAQPEKPFDLSALKKLNLDGKIHVGSLKAHNVKVSNINVDIKAHHGVLNVSPLSAKLYNGGLNGSVTVNAVTSTPVFTVNQTLSGIDIGPLLKDAANFGSLEGKGNVALNVSTRGNLVSALKRSLAGSASVNLADGAIRGINIAKKLREAQAMFGKGGSSQTQAADQNEKTDFSSLKASFKIRNGVAHNDDLALLSPLLRVTGSGDIDIGHDSLNYVTKAKLVGSLQGQGGQSNLSGLTVPVRLSGPYSNLKYTLDFGAMVSEAAKQKVRTEIKNKLQDQLKNGLKGLFR